MSVKVKWAGAPSEVTVTNSYGTIETDQFDWNSAPVATAAKVFLLNLEQRGQQLEENLQQELLTSAASPQENCWDLREWELFEENKEVFGRYADVWLTFEEEFSSDAWNNVTSENPNLVSELKDSGMTIVQEKSL